MKMLLALSIVLGFVSADSPPLLCLDPQLIEASKATRLERDDLDDKNFSEMLTEATEYFSSFSFQEYRAFRRKQTKRSVLYVHALKDFFANFRRYIEESEYQAGMVFPIPGENPYFDYVYALSLTTHYISPVGQLPLALRDGFRPISLHDLMVRGLTSKSLGRSVFELVQENRDLVFLYLQTRFNASVYFSLYPVFSYEQSFLQMISSWQFEFDKLQSEDHITRLGFLVESAVESQEILKKYKVAITPVFVSRLGISKTSLSEILRTMEVPSLEISASQKRFLYAQRLSHLLQKLKKTIL